MPAVPLQMERMDKSLESVKRSFATVRTGRANPAMLDRVEVGGALRCVVVCVAVLLLACCYCCCAVRS